MEPVSIETATSARKNMLTMLLDLRSKYLSGKFSRGDLMKDFRYDSNSANATLEALAKNGLLNMAVTANNVIYSFVNDPENQISNIMGWINRNKGEIEYYELMIDVIKSEMKVKGIIEPEMKIEANENPTGINKN